MIRISNAKDAVSGVQGVWRPRACSRGHPI